MCQRCFCVLVVLLEGAAVPPLLLALGMLALAVDLLLPEGLHVQPLVNLCKVHLHRHKAVIRASPAPAGPLRPDVIQCVVVQCVTLTHPVLRSTEVMSLVLPIILERDPLPDTSLFKHLKYAAATQMYLKHFKSIFKHICCAVYLYLYL